MSCRKNWYLGGPFGGYLGGVGTPKVFQNICLLNICWYHKTLALKLSRSKNWFLGDPFGESQQSIWGVPGGWHPQTMSKYLSAKSLLISKQTGTLSWAIHKIDIWGVSGGVARPNYVKIFFCQISADIIKHWHPSLGRSKNWYLGGLFDGSSGGSGTPKLCQIVCLLTNSWYQNKLEP